MGKEYNWIHEVKDLSVRSLGFKHRAAMHDHETALLLALIGRDLGIYYACILHDVCDQAAVERKKHKQVRT